MIALVVINAIGCYILMSSAPREQDDAYVQQSRTIVEQTLSKIAKTNQTVNSDYSAWSDAYKNISINYDENWVKENYYSDITSANAVFRPGTGILFAHASKDIATFRASLSEFVSTLDLSSHQKYNDNPVEKNVIVSPNTFVVLTDTIYALSMQPIRPDTLRWSPDFEQGVKLVSS